MSGSDDPDTDSGSDPGSGRDGRDGSAASDRSGDRDESEGTDDRDEWTGLATGWQVWSENSGKIVLVYRPNVFDAREFPAPCLPTIYVTQGRRSRRPGTDPQPRPGDRWYVTFFLEPDVERETESYDDRTEAIAATRILTERFAGGDLDYRSLYQVPREAYLDRLDELTGRGEGIASETADGGSERE